MTELADLYLSLLKRTLTRYELEGDWRYVSVARPMPSSLRKRMTYRGAKALRAAGYEVVRRERIDPQTRLEGQDWPQNAETMIGLARLNQLHAAVEDVIANDVPGDLIETGAWRGGACILMRGVLAARGVTDRTVWVADSFEGLPKPSAEYSEYIEDGMAFWGVQELVVSQEEVEANFAKYGLLDGQVRFLKGWSATPSLARPLTTSLCCGWTATSTKARSRRYVSSTTRSLRAATSSSTTTAR